MNAFHVAANMAGSKTVHLDDSLVEWILREANLWLPTHIFIVFKINPNCLFCKRTRNEDDETQKKELQKTLVDHEH